ncbi:MAG: glycosyltransferase family 4 protein [Candidatus Daviesbacteria bacterium]|nr:glycosyltransferase family 4 protein [Candidatus Daviesbacteria bacterium]
MRKLKICFVTEDFYPDFIGGQGVYGYHLVSELAKMGHQVTVLVEKRPGRREFWKDYKNIRLIEVPFCFGNKLILGIWEYLFFWKFCSGESFDIIHLNGLSGWLFVLFKPKNVSKMIVMDHNTNYEMSLHTRSRLKKLLYSLLIHMEKRLFESADGILFNNPEEEKKVKNYYKIDQKPTKAVYLGVEPIKFSLEEQNKARLALRRKLDWPANAKIVLYVGRLVERKKVDTLVMALKNVPAYGVIVGRGPELDNLKFEIKNLKLENIKFVGWTYQPREYYLASDCFVTVSVAEGGFLITALEAASYGLPLILSPSAAGFPIVKKGRNGYIVDPDDPKELAEKIKMVILRLRSGQVGEESRKLAKQFSWEKCSRETINFYQQLLGRS